tara:strand:+ start:137 stop:337 length:201 start_codon:yes stop_codon:yes gene_type:complete
MFFIKVMKHSYLYLGIILILVVVSGLSMSVLDDKGWERLTYEVVIPMAVGLISIGVAWMLDQIEGE